jgi:hypothetical protein
MSTLGTSERAPLVPEMGTLSRVPRRRAWHEWQKPSAPRNRLLVASKFAPCGSPKLLLQGYLYHHYAWTPEARNGVFWGYNEGQKALDGP